MERIFHLMECDWCGVTMPGRDKTNCGAVQVTLGYSDGAWGARQDYLETGEFPDLCLGCYTAFHAWAMTYHDLRENRRQSR